MRVAALLVLAGCNPTIDYAGIELGCTQTGGSLTTTECCSEARDYPITCDLEPCACSGDTKTVLYCLCSAGSCFDGEFCVID